MKLLQAAAKAAGDVGTQYAQSIIDERILDKRMERLMGVERVKHGMSMERLDKEWENRGELQSQQQAAQMERLRYQANQPQLITVGDEYRSVRPGDVPAYDPDADRPLLDRARTTQAQQDRLDNLYELQQTYAGIESPTPEQMEQLNRIQAEINRLSMGEEGYERYQQQQHAAEFENEVRGIKQFWMQHGQPQSQAALEKMMADKGVPTTPEAVARAWKEISGLIKESAEGGAAGGGGSPYQQTYESAKQRQQETEKQQAETTKRIAELGPLGNDWNKKGIDIESAKPLLFDNYEFISKNWWRFTRPQRKGFRAAMEQINKDAGTEVFPLLDVNQTTGLETYQ